MLKKLSSRRNRDYLSSFTHTLLNEIKMDLNTSAISTSQTFQSPMPISGGY